MTSKLPLSILKSKVKVTVIFTTKTGLQSSDAIVRFVMTITWLILIVYQRSRSGLEVHVTGLIKGTISLADDFVSTVQVNIPTVRPAYSCLGHVIKRIRHLLTFDINFYCYITKIT